LPELVARTVELREAEFKFAVEFAGALAAMRRVNTATVNAITMVDIFIIGVVERRKL
jgi:hypothetical protein